MLRNESLKQELLDLNLCHPDKLESLIHLNEFFQTETVTEWIWSFLVLHFPKEHQLLEQADISSDYRWHCLMNVRRRIMKELEEMEIQEFLSKNMMKVRRKRRRKMAMVESDVDTRILKRIRESAQGVF